MRDEILRVIEEENRKLNPKEILDLIKEDNTVDDLRSLIHELDLMCRDGILRCGSGNTYFYNDLLTGVVDMHEKGNAHVILKEDMNDIFIPRDMLKGACDKDTVSIEITSRDKNEGKVVKILKRSLGSGVGEVVDNDGVYSIKVLSDLPYEVEVMESDLNLVDGLLVHLDYVKDIDRKKVLAKIDSVICHKNAPGKESQIALIATEFNLRLEFPEEVKEEASKMPRALTEEMIKEGFEEGREDFRGDVIFTIDGKDTKDIDDAISLRMLDNGNYELGVHIADVSHYVKVGSPLWKEAEIRGNSNYLGNKVLPMLPVELSNGICSLNPNEDRFTESCIMEIDYSGKVLNKRVVKGIIKSKKKMNYDAVEDILEDKTTEDTVGYDTLKYTVKKDETVESIAYSNNMTKEELLEYNKESDIKEGNEINIPCSVILKNMNALSKRISNYKEKRGELSFESDEAYIKMDENDRVIDIIPRVQRDAEKLIENFMVAANESVAEFLTEYEVATYRIHEHPLEKKMEDYLKFLELLGIHYPGKINTANVSSKDCQKLLEYLKDEKAYNILNKKLLRSMQKARYSTENSGHFGIASPCYTHFTSPIRRMDDLLNHTSITQILKSDFLEEKYIKSWNAYLNVMCDQISACERNSEKCEFAVDDMLKADYMLDHIGEDFEGTVDTLLSTSFFVQTDSYIEGRVDTVLKDDKETSVVGNFDYNENLMAYTRNGRVVLRYGDRVLVRCIGADPEKREVDFALVKKV